MLCCAQVFTFLNGVVIKIPAHAFFWCVSLILKGELSHLYCQLFFHLGIPHSPSTLAFPWGQGPCCTSIFISDPLSSNTGIVGSLWMFMGMYNRMPHSFSLLLRILQILPQLSSFMSSQLTLLHLRFPPSSGPLNFCITHCLNHIL